VPVVAWRALDEWTTAVGCRLGALRVAGGGGGLALGFVAAAVAGGGVASVSDVRWFVCAVFLSGGGLCLSPGMFECQVWSVLLPLVLEEVVCLSRLWF